MNITPQIVYSPLIEKGFCMRFDGGVHNVLAGGLMSAPMPLCNRTDVVMHSHPVWAEQCANIVDFIVWEEYRKRYGNEFFGVCGSGWLRVYVYEP